MKNDNYSVSPNKKSYAFKPKNSKIKRNEFDTVLNNILKKSKERGTKFKIKRKYKKYKCNNASSTRKISAEKNII